MPLITSVHNPRVKDAVRLRDARHRQKEGRIVIDGLRELGRAIQANVELIEVFVCDRFRHTPQGATFVEWLPPGIDINEVTAPVFEKLAYGQRNEGVVAVARPPQRRLAELELPANALVAVVEAVEKPGNLGAVLRSADGAGLAAVIVADGRTDIYNPNTIRASLGTVFTMPVCDATAAEALAWLRVRGITIYVARVDGSLPYTAADFRGIAAIVLGSEAQGLSMAWQGPDVHAIRLPMCGQADSLNVSATAAVLFYEALRQRTAERETTKPSASAEG